MANSCILVRLTVGKHQDTLEEARKFDEVKEAFFVFGRYDMIVLARAQDRDSLIRVAAKISALPGVRATETLIEA